MKSISLSWTKAADITIVADLLKNNQVVISSTDTTLGLLAPLTRKGFDALNFLKGRADKPYLVLIGSPEKFLKFVREPLDKDIKNLVEKAWPSPLTIIVKAKLSLPLCLVSSDATIALRMPNHSGLLALLEEFDGLFSTSVNKAGQPVCSSIAEIDLEIRKNVSCVITDFPDPLHCYPTIASTIFDCSKIPCNIIRSGAYNPSPLYLDYPQLFKK